jgi:hypothetical protein
MSWLFSLLFIIFVLFVMGQQTPATGDPAAEEAAKESQKTQKEEIQKGKSYGSAKQEAAKQAAASYKWYSPAWIDRSMGPSKKYPNRAECEASCTAHGTSCKAYAYHTKGSKECYLYDHVQANTPLGYRTMKENYPWGVGIRP